MAVTNYDYAIELQTTNIPFMNPAMVGGLTNWIGGRQGWTDLTNDALITESIVLDYGIKGSTPLDRVASAGSLTWRANNDKSNSNHYRGFYAPFNSQHRSSFTFNAAIRFRVTFEGVTRYKFFGSLASIVPLLEEFSTTKCTALDIFDDFARNNEPEIPAQFVKRADEVLDTIFDALEETSMVRNFETGQETFTVAIDGGTGQQLKIRERINQLCLSEWGYCHTVGDDIGAAPNLMFESRLHRAANPDIMFELTNEDFTLDGNLSVLGSRDDFYRSVIVSVHPTNDVILATRVDLFNLGTSQTYIGPGETNDSIFGNYHDPVSNDQVGGTNELQPVAGIDYVMNSEADGNGTDLTANFSVVAATTGWGVRFFITNNGLRPAFVVKLKLRGVPIIRYDADIKAEVNGSVGDQVLEIDQPFQNNVNRGRDVAHYVAQSLAQPYANLPPIRFLANRTPAHLHAAFELEIGDRISVHQTDLGIIHQPFTINSIKLEFTGENEVFCTWGLEPATKQRFWIMGVVGSSELGVDTYFGF